MKRSIIYYDFILIKSYQILLILTIFLQIHIVYGNAKIVDKTVALINNHILLDSNIKNKMHIMSYYIPNTTQKILQYDTSYQSTLNQLIIDELIMQAAQQQKIHFDHILSMNNHIINDIAHLHNMTSNQFQEYISNIGIDYKKYHSQINQEILKKNICEHIVYQRAHLYIPTHEVNQLAQQLNDTHHNKQFKLTHILFTLPIHPTIHQINKTEYLVQSLINNHQFNTHARELIYQYPNHDIFQTITIHNTQWISWKNIPIILNKYLHTIKKGDIVGPIYDYHGIHIIIIQDVNEKIIQFPIIKMNIRKISLQNLHKTNDTIEQLLKIKKYLENNTIKPNQINEKCSEYSYLQNYKEHLEWKDLDEFTPNVQKKLLVLKPNEISAPIYINSEWNLIQLQDTVVMDYNTTLHERAYLYLLHQKFNKIINDWILELQSQSYIKIIN